MSQEYSVKDIVEQFQKGSIEQINLDQRNGRTITQSQAGTESESSKDYVGRVAYEFFQNAVDRANSQIWMELTKEAFIISNDGEPFSIYTPQTNEKKSDFHSLNSIHNGEKVAGESIGNKGVGFKSCWNVSKHVKIESVIKEDDEVQQEAWGFELFNPVTIDNFTDDSIKEAIEKAGGRVPSFYFPKYIESKKEYFRDGTVTKITIFLKDTDIYNEIKKELEEFKKTKFLFLNLLKGKEDKKYQIHIIIEGITNTIDSKYSKELRKDLKTLEKESEYYKECYLQLLKEREKETYKNIPKEPNIAISFPLDNEKIDAKFYTYLPTEKECGFNILIHADFALDNARKHIPENNYNDTILQIAAKMSVNELLNNTKLHNYENFALFLMPKDKNDKFAKLVWEDLIKDNKLTQILQKVYTKDRNFPKRSYELIFNVISQWHRERNSGEWKDGYFQDIYDKTIQYFCNENIYIVWIDEKNKTFLPPKKEDRNYTYSLFVKEKDELDYSLLEDIKNIKITTFESLVDKTEFFKNNIVRKFSLLEILRVLKNFKKKKIIYFVQQLLDEKKEELSQDVKKELLDIKIPINEEFVEVKKCFINIAKEIQELFTDEFKKIDIEKFDGIDIEFLTKIGVANNRLPFFKDKKEIVLPFKENITYPKSNTMKDLVLNTLFDDEVIEKLSSIQWFYDERKEKLFAPKEVFLFKEHDNRKIECIAQEKKNKKYQELYNRFNIEEIDETTDSEKLINQLKKMQHTTIDTFHQEIYKKVTYTLSKIDNIEDYNIPILVTSIDANTEVKYISNDEKAKVVFLETKYKKYKDQIKDNYNFLAHFDNNISDKFLEKIGIQKFNPNYTIEYKNKNGEKTEPQEDKKIKEFLQDEFLATFFALANEIVGSRFEKEDALKRWEDLVIKKSYNVILTIKDKNKSIVVSSTKEVNIDVLYIPIKDKQHKPTHIGEVAHDLSDFKNNSNIRKFAQVFAEGIFRDMRLKSNFELYITASLTQDENLKKEILINNGIEDIHINEMKTFIKSNLLDETAKKAIIDTVQKLNLKSNIIKYQDIFDFKNYENIDMSFEDFKSKFDEKYQFIAQNIIDGYKSYYQSQMENLIQNNQQELEVLCFIQYKNREYFKNKSREIRYKNITTFQKKSNIFNLFNVEKIDIKSDKYIQGMLDLEYHTDEIKANKLNLERKTASLQAKINPSTGDAQQSKQSTKEQEEKLEKRGLGQELKIAYEYAKKVDKKAFIRTIKEQIFIDDAALKINTNLQKYIDALDTYKETDNLTFARKVIQIASNKLDGLGYDLIIPDEKNNILKVELKSTTQSDNIEVHFSKNEIERIIHYMEVDNYRIWLNNEMNDITKQVKDAVSELKGLNLPFYSKDYILTLGTTK